MTQETGFTATPVMLRTIPFFQGLEEGELTAAARLLRIENHRRGALLAGRGFQKLEAYRSTVYFVYQGVAAVYTLTSNASRKILFFLGPGKLTDHHVLDTRPGNLFVEIAADAILLAADRGEFAALVRRTPALMEALASHYETDLWRMSHQLKNTAGYVSVERKVAIKLLKLSREFGVSWGEAGVALRFDLTVTQLADFVGVPRETASRACRRLAELGLVAYEGRRFVLPSRENLSAYYRGETLE